MAIGMRGQMRAAAGDYRGALPDFSAALRLMDQGDERARSEISLLRGEVLVIYTARHFKLFQDFGPIISLLMILWSWIVGYLAVCWDVRRSSSWSNNYHIWTYDPRLYSLS